jgi:glycosyltransferase involved in cell wall biosynthesis
LLALAARLRGTQVIIEFHEVLDTGEARIPLARLYVGLLAPLLVRLANGFVIHSEFDRPHLEKRYKLGKRPVALIPHGPYDHYAIEEKSEALEAVAMSESNCCNLLYFGVIRPYKGLEDLLRAFEAIREEEIGKYRLTIVGETWEGWTLPNELIERSRYRERINFINRYVRDEEVAQFFAEADAVVLPYQRSSASGPLHIAMSQGLPLVVTQIGGLVEAVANYEGGVLVPPQNSTALKEALVKVAAMKGKRFADPHSWQNTVACYNSLFSTLKSRWHVIKEKIAA